MNKYLRVILLLVGPLVLIAGVALSVYGLQGPADDDQRANAIARFVGAGYGVYAVVIITWFIKKGRHV
jgi:hypothetical protein